MIDDTELLARIRRLAQFSWPNWYRAASSASPQPRPYDPSETHRVEIDTIRQLEGRRAVAISKGRLGEAELLEKRQRERMVELVTHRPDGVERVINWLCDVAEAADMLGQQKTVYARMLQQAGPDALATLADALFMHALPFLAEKEGADLEALAKRVSRCKPEVREAAADGPPACPLGGRGRRPATVSYEERMAKNRVHWAATRGNGKRGAYGASGPRSGSLNEARIWIRDTAAVPPAHLNAALDAALKAKQNGEKGKARKKAS